MKRLIILFLLLALTACLPVPITLVPPETLAAQTMAAMPRTDTPTVGPTDTTVPTPTVELEPPTPEINSNAPGASCIPTDTQRVRALVSKVLDGESIEVVTENETFRVRYIGMDAPGIAPELEWQGPQSIASNEQLVNGKYVTLVMDTTNIDAEGYYLRYVLVDDIFVNYDQIRRGLASVNIIPPDMACQNEFMAAQLEAQTVIAGIWQPTPLPTFTITPTPTETLIPTATEIPKPAPCSCRRTYSCNNFWTQYDAQECYDYCLSEGYGPVLPDKNNNGLVCEGLP
jgi:micrococcal nuclease